MTDKTPPAAPAPAPKDAPSELVSLRQENARLRAQLAAAGRTVAPAAGHTFVLSEGARQELLATGRATIDGRSYTRAEVKAELGDAQSDVDLEGAPDPAPLPVAPAPTNIRGVDFVYPSVARGELDPAVAGAPGVSGRPARAQQK